MISVIVPNYNHAPYLNRRIDSILNQTYQNFELIILDDKSNDNSKEIIEQYRSNPHISHIIYNEENTGSTFKQWNKGISLAQGEYIWLAESDDVADPELLQTLFNNINKDVEIVLSFCQSYQINGQGEITGDFIARTEDINPELFATEFVMDGKEFTSENLIYRNIIPNASAVLFKKEIFSKIGTASDKVSFSADWLLWMQILEYGKVIFSPRKLNYFRRHDKSWVISSITNIKNLFIKKYEIILRIAYLKYLRKKDLSDNLYHKTYERNKMLLEECLKIESVYLWNAKQYKSSLKYFLSAIYYSNNKIETVYKAIKLRLK